MNLKPRKLGKTLNDVTIEGKSLFTMASVGGLHLQSVWHKRK